MPFAGAGAALRQSLFWLVNSVRWLRNSSPSFSGGANPGLSFSGGKPRSQLHLSQQLKESKAVESSVIQSLAVLHRTEEMRGFGIFLAIKKAIGGAECEFETQNIFFLIYLKLSKLNLERNEGISLS